MSKVTSKLQVTIPKTIAGRHGIEPGSEIHFESAGDAIRVTTLREDTVEYAAGRGDREFRLRLFDEATARQQAREAGQRERLGMGAERGWKREDLYTRGDAGTA